MGGGRNESSMALGMRGMGGDDGGMVGWLGVGKKGGNGIGKVRMKQDLVLLLGLWSLYVGFLCCVV